MKQILLLLAFLIAQTTFAQSQQNELAVTIGAVTMPAFNKQNIGVDLSARYYLTDAFSGGLSFSTSNPKYSHGFGYDTDRTLINRYHIGIPLQYDVVNNEKLTLGFGFSNGILLNVLRNRNDGNEVVQYDPDTGMGFPVQIPTLLKTDSYYTLTPYAEASYRLIALGTREKSIMYLTAKAGYQNVFGKGSFSKSNDFRNYIVSLGFTFKGTIN